MTEVSHTRWSLVVLATFAGAVGSMQIGKAPPAIPELRVELALGLVAAGWIASIFSATSAALGASAGIVADRFGHRHTAVGGLVILAVGSVLGGLAPSGQTLLAARFIEGVGFLVIVVACPSLIARVCEPRHLRLAIGVWASYMPAGVATMMLLSPLLLEAVGWRGLWLANAALALAAAGAFWMMTHGLELPATGRRSWSDVRLATMLPGPWLLAGCFACYSLQFFAVISWLPTFLVEELGVPLALAAFLTALAVAVNMIGAWLGGWLLHRGVQRWVLLAMVAAVVSVLAVAVYSAPLPIGARVLCAFVFSMIGGILPTACLAGAPVHAPSPAQVGAVNGIIVQGANLGTLLGPPALAAAVALAGGWREAGWLLSLAGAGGVVFALGLGRVEHRSISVV